MSVGLVLEFYTVTRLLKMIRAEKALKMSWRTQSMYTTKNQERRGWERGGGVSRVNVRKNVGG